MEPGAWIVLGGMALALAFVLIVRAVSAHVGPRMAAADNGYRAKRSHRRNYAQRQF